MKSIKLTPEGDIDLSSGNFQYVEGSAYVRQKCQTRLKFFLGEWFLDTRLGFPWFQEVLGKKEFPGKIETLVKRALTTIPEVAEIVSLTYEFSGDTRLVTVTFSIRTGDGVLISGGVPFLLGGT